jgi:hypothetical protein
MSTEPNDNELIAGTLAGLEATPDDELPSAHYGTEPEPNEAGAEVASPTLQQLEASRRPKVSTVCETCRNSVWFTTPAEVKCYCRVMYLITWSNKEPTQFTGCDGLYIGQEG